jgi:23S rRNA pseudouridine1911/1915/1917 synthase
MMLPMISEELPAALDGERIDRIVALLADVSRSIAVQVIDAGAVRVNGDVATSGKVRLPAGSVVEIDTAAIKEPDPPSADPDVQFGVVYEDESVIVVDKPAGLVVHPGAGNRDGTLVSGLLARFPDLAHLQEANLENGSVGEPDRPGIVHRLDAGSSGLLVVARTAAAASALVAQFAAHTAGRRYTALVWGHPSAAHGIIDAPIGRDPGDPLRMAVVVDGKPARTEYEITEKLYAPADVALLTCRLQTGRTHQIRVHLTGIGHPLVGDSTYGDRRTTFGLTRPFLHAAELAFDHPASGERVTFTSPLAADLAALLATLEPAPH